VGDPGTPRIVSGSSIGVIKLTGELDIGRRDEIRAALHLAGDEAGMLIDFSEVTYADSTMLAQLLRLRTEATEQCIPLAIVIGSRQFARLIEYAGLSEAFAIFDTRAAALSHLAAARPA
jgi:anti-anti-sigma factor